MVTPSVSSGEKIPIELLTQITNQRHEYARDWMQRKDSRVLGCLCSYVPEEIIYASGLLPVRLMGGHEAQTLTDPHIYGMCCAYCRDVLGQALMGKYDYVSGIVLAHVCPQMMQPYHSWCKHLGPDFSHLLWLPSQILRKSALSFFLSQLEEFQRRLEEWLGKQITEDDLRQSIEVYNVNRGLLRQLYQFRKETPARISGRLALEAVLAGTLMDKAEHNVLLEEVLASPKEVQGGVRLMVVGSENDDTELIGMLEAMGSVVVIEDHCLGTRLFWDDVTTDDEPLSAIARRYLGKPPCPLLDCGERQRGEYLQKMAREYQVEGIIFLRQKFCDAHAWDQPFLQTMFQEMGLSCLSLELDVTVPTGQYKTRVEAFLEVLDLEGE